MHNSSDKVTTIKYRLKNVTNEDKCHIFYHAAIKGLAAFKYILISYLKAV